jgi:hypothetical protein
MDDDSGKVQEALCVAIRGAGRPVFPASSTKRWYMADPKDAETYSEEETVARREARIEADAGDSARQAAQVKGTGT